MALLSEKEVARYALAHGKVFFAGCDESNCGKLIAPSELYVVVKTCKRTDGLTFLGCIPTKVRCMTCQLERHPIKEEVKVVGAGRGAKKVSQEVASKLTLNPIVRRAAMSILKRAQAPVPIADMTAKLRKKKAIREIKKGEVSATLRAMKKLKLVRLKAKAWVLTPEKKKRPAKTTKKKLKKVVAES